MPILVVFEGKIPSPLTTVSSQYYTTLQTLLKHQAGFISETPYLSIDQPGQQVLIAEFTDEAALHAWRKQHTHLLIEAKSRSDVFVDYRIRSGAEVVVDGVDVVEDGGSEDDDVGKKGTTTGSVGKYLLLRQFGSLPESSASGPGEDSRLVPFDAWTSLVDAATYQGEKLLQITSWRTLSDASMVRKMMSSIEGTDARLICVERDYGKYHREEAPADADERQTEALGADV